MLTHRLHLVIALAICSLSLNAQTTYTEVEPNETKSTATPANPMVVGDMLTGTTTGSVTTPGLLTNLDHFLVTIPTSPTPAITRYALTLSSAVAGHTATIRGLSQSAGVIGTTDSTAQTGQTVAPNRVNVFYSFGNGGSLYYRVAGTATTVQPYTTTLSSTPVVPVSMGSFQGGPITVSTDIVGQTTDTDIWVYDASLNPIPGFGNDDRFSSTSSRSHLVRTFLPGTYYVAVTNFNFANNQASPTDDDFRSGTVTDFAGVAVNSSTSTALTLNLSVTDCAGTVTSNSTKAAAFDINWYTFTVLPNGSPWETNDAACSIDIDAVPLPPSGPATTVKCTSSFAHINLGTTLAGNAWDLGVSLLPAVSAPTGCGPGTGGLATPNGQKINLDLPTTAFTFNLAFTNVFPGNFYIPLTLGTPVPNISFQWVILDPAHLDGVSLSAPAQLTFVNSIPGPVGDDVVSEVNFQTCLSFPVPFYGVSHTRLFVSTNGIVTFNAGDTSFTPSVASAISGAPRVGLWSDLLATVGAITIDVPGSNNVSINYGVGTTNLSSGSPCEFDLNFEVFTGVITASLTNVGAGTASQFVGISKGGGTATNGGASTFTPATSGITTNATDMIYSFGLQGSGVTGLTSLVFTPNGLGNYNWTSN